MKKLLFSGAAFLLMLSSCQKEADLGSSVNNGKSYKNTTTNVSYCGTPQTVNLIAGQHIQAGTVTVGNDANNLYVTYSTQSSAWLLTELHLYVGDCNTMPVNGPGNPVPGRFPYKAAFNGPNYSKEYTFVIPLSSLPRCFCVAAHAAVITKGSNGKVNGSETAWGEGARFVPKGNWGMYFNSCKQDCRPEGEGCGYRAPYWFNGLNNWPTGQVTVGGHTYTQQEGFALGYEQNNGTYSPAVYIMFQVASVYLSGNNIGAQASILNDVQIAEAWLATQGKFSPGNAPTEDLQALNAAYNIDAWLDQNDCE